MFRVLFALAAFSLAAPIARGAAGDPLDEALIEKASGILDALKKKGFVNVGVVKFLVRHGDGEPQDDVGDLNLSLANKVEVALILANTDEKFGIIDKASEAVVREKLLAANHRTEEGRKAFFVRKYELAWSRDKVDASGFVTGIATFSQDLAKLPSSSRCSTRAGRRGHHRRGISPTNPRCRAGRIQLRPRAGAAEGSWPATAAGSRRGEARDRGAGREERRALPKGTDEPFPLASARSNGPCCITASPSRSPATRARAEADGPRRVALSNPTQGTYAVVLLVNGENTLYQERVAPQVCRKWVLGPQSSVSIRGFQTGTDAVAPFAVLAPEQPLDDAVRYGDHAGTFRLIVFHGKMSDANPADNMAKLKPEDAATLALSRTRGGTRPSGVKPQTLKALQADLRGRIGTDGARGYVVKSGATEKFETRSVYFIATPELPVADISLRYFTPKK